MNQDAPSKKRRWPLWLGGAILLLIIIGILAPKDEKLTSDSAPNTAESAAVAPNDTSTTTPTAEDVAASVAAAGLGKTRQEFINHYSRYPHNVEFVAGSPIDGMENYSGKGESNIIVQIIGPEDDIRQVSTTFLRDGGDSQRALSNLGVISFLTKFGLDESNWAIETIEQQGDGDWSESKNFGSRTVELTSVNIEGVQALTVAVKS